MGTQQLIGSLAGAVFGCGLVLVWLWWESSRVTLRRRVTPYLPSKKQVLPQPLSVPKQVLVLVSGPVLYFAEAASSVLGLNAKSLPQRLRLAGVRLEPSRFRQFQVLSVFTALAAAAAFITVGALLANFNLVGSIVMTACFTLAGALAPNWWLGQKVAKRQRLLDTQLPDFVEMLALSVGAGQSIAVGLDRAATACGGPVEAEMKLTLTRCQTGDPLPVALKQLRGETESVPLQRLVDALVGALERGNSLALILRDQALDTRRQSRQNLMEAGGKAEVAMLVPVVFGILPLSVIFALYPGLIALQMTF